MQNDNFYFRLNVEYALSFTRNRTQRERERERLHPFLFFSIASCFLLPPSGFTFWLLYKRFLFQFSSIFPFGFLSLSDLPRNVQHKSHPHSHSSFSFPISFFILKSSNKSFDSHSFFCFNSYFRFSRHRFFTYPCRKLER